MGGLILYPCLVLKIKLKKKKKSENIFTNVIKSIVKKSNIFSLIIIKTNNSLLTIKLRYILFFLKIILDIFLFT